MSYTVLYSPDNGSSWIPIQTSVSDTSLNWTVPNDHPTDQCKVKVVATDGVNTGDVISSEAFTILRHDISATEFDSSKGVIFNGFSVPMHVIVENVGNFTETLTVQIIANSTPIITQTLILAEGESGTLNLSWNTISSSLGNYSMNACVWPVPNEKDTVDNNFTGGWVFVSMIGDLTGPTPFVPDGKCDIRDIALVAKAFGSSPGTAEWNPNCDVTGLTPGAPDNKVDIRDIALIAKHFGEHSP